MELREEIAGWINNYGCDCVFIKTTSELDELQLADKIIEMVRRGIDAEA